MTRLKTNIKHRTSNIEHRSEDGSKSPHFNVRRSTFDVRCSHFSSPSTRGFTLVEVLAALLLLAIVLPVVDRGIISASDAGSAARHRTEAASLAQSKLAELTTTATWSGGQLSGDFGNDWAAYRWQASVVGWTNDTQGVGLQQLDVTVTWKVRGNDDSLTISSLVYSRPVPTS